MQCNLCGKDLLIDYDKDNKNIIITCNCCNNVIDKAILKPSDIISMVKSGSYSKTIEEESYGNSENYIQQLIKKHSLYKILNENI